MDPLSMIEPAILPFPGRTFEQFAEALDDEPKRDPFLIGLGHYSRTGKDTFCRLLTKELAERNITASRVAFADAVKQVAYQLFSWAGLREAYFYETHPGERSSKLPRAGLTPVEIWVAVGNRMRDVYPDVWVNIVLDELPASQVAIITDVRFPNEVAAIKERGGKVLKIVRPGVEPLPTDSDRALLGYDEWDGVINNNRGADDLRAYAQTWAKLIQDKVTE